MTIKRDIHIDIRKMFILCPYHFLSGFMTDVWEWEYTYFDSKDLLGRDEGVVGQGYIRYPHVKFLIPVCLYMFYRRVASWEY